MSIVIPGERLGLITEYFAGPGTFVNGKIIYSSLVGKRITLQTEENSQLTLSVQQWKQKNASDHVIEAGDIITGRIIRISTKQANVEILFVGNNSLQNPRSGVIRKEDIKKEFSDSLQIQECFHLGDFIIARVISLGDAKQFYLSTAEDELGVKYAKGTNGNIMIPISLNEVECPVTKNIENRKCAKTIVNIS